MDTEATLKAGDVCRDCQLLGLEKYLRYFKINLNGDTLLKCESNECMFPYNDEMSSSDEGEENAGNIAETSSLKFINDFIQQCSNENEVQNTNDAQINENATEQVVKFDITFLDDINEIDNTNACKPENSEENDQLCDNKLNIEVTENKYVPLPNLNPVEYEIPSLKNNKQIFNKMSCLNLTDDTIKDCKRKIDIQSIETIKFETPSFDNLYTSSTTFISKNSYTPVTALVPHITELTPTETASKSLRKYRPKSKTSESKKGSLKISKSTSAKLCGLNNKSPTKSKSSDIPKADIMKGNSLLRKLAEVNEKSPVSIRKSFQNKRTAKNEEIKNQELIPSSSTGVDYSIDKISEILLTNKINRNVKK